MLVVVGCLLVVVECLLVVVECSLVFVVCCCNWSNECGVTSKVQSSHPSQSRDLLRVEEGPQSRRSFLQTLVQSVALKVSAPPVQVVSIVRSGQSFRVLRSGRGLCV